MFLSKTAVLLPAQSNLIDKSPLIGSISRTLSWDSSCAETASSYPSRPSKPSLVVKDYEQECFFFVQTLLSESSFDNVAAPPDSFLARWHSPESPLDPLLRDKYTDTKDKELMHEANRRRMRSTRKLVFDCVNEALVDLAGCGSDTCQRVIPCGGPHHHHHSHHHHASHMMVDRVWDRMKEWFTGGDGGDNDSVVVESVVRKEVAGRGWADDLRLETDNLRKEIEIGLLEELVHEVAIEFTGKLQ